MTELTDLNDTDALNTAISGQSIVGNTANMGGMDNLQQAIAGMLSRFRNANIFRLRDNTDKTKLLAFDLSGLTTATTRTHKAPNYNGTLASQAVGAAIASASSIDLGAASGSTVHITGTTTITALGTADAGIEKTVVFDGILTLTHNATSLILPGAANISTAVGDAAVFVSEGSGNWKCSTYTRASGGPVLTLTALGAAPIDPGVDGLGSVMFCRTNGNVMLAGDTIAGSGLNPASLDDSGNYVSDGGTLSGTWRNMGGSKTATYRVGIFQRVA